MPVLAYGGQRMEPFLRTTNKPLCQVIPGLSSPEAECLDEIQTKVKEFFSLLFTVTSTALPRDFYFFKLTQPLTVYTVQLLYTVKEKGGKTDRKLYPLSFGLRNPYMQKAQV